MKVCFIGSSMKTSSRTYSASRCDQLIQKISLFGQRIATTNLLWRVPTIPSNKQTYIIRTADHPLPSNYLQSYGRKYGNSNFHLKLGSSFGPSVKMLSPLRPISFTDTLVQTQYVAYVQIKHRKHWSIFSFSIRGLRSYGLTLGFAYIFYLLKSIVLKLGLLTDSQTIKTHQVWRWLLLSSGKSRKHGTALSFIVKTRSPLCRGNGLGNLQLGEASAVHHDRLHPNSNGSRVSVVAPQSWYTVLCKKVLLAKPQHPPPCRSKYKLWI